MSTGLILNTFMAIKLYNIKLYKYTASPTCPGRHNKHVYVIYA